MAYQPNMIRIYTLRVLLTSLAPLIGAETALEHAVPQNWAEGRTKEELAAWREAGMQLEEEVESVVQEEAGAEYGRLMRKRLGLRVPDLTDEVKLFRPLLDMMEVQQLDFHRTFRTLCAFWPSWLSTSTGSKDALESFITKLVSGTPDSPSTDRGRAAGEWMRWLEAYAAWIESADKRAL
ncbi:hypothetical protein DXG01_011191 [Tephrocybe rancida]|nr:hypothetical protein DXG01_011191 [Tephrocybe rancida]